MSLAVVRVALVGNSNQCNLSNNFPDHRYIKSRKIQEGTEMITNIAFCTVAKLKESGAIKDEDCDLFVYGFFLIYSSFVAMAITLLSGVAFGVIWESIFFYCMFTPLRNFAGGIHAHTEVVCNIATTVALSGAMLLIRIMKSIGFTPLYIVVMLFSAAIVIVLSPMDSEGKRLTANEKTCYKRKTVSILIGILLVSFVSLVFNYYVLFYAAYASILLEALLLLAQYVRIWLKSYQ